MSNMDTHEQHYKVLLRLRDGKRADTADISVLFSSLTVLIFVAVYAQTS